jgi:hypothetical protein
MDRTCCRRLHPLRILTIRIVHVPFGTTEPGPRAIRDPPSRCHNLFEVLTLAIPIAAETLS